jgi:hypothetical protein
MCKDFDLVPGIEVHGCVVDLVGRVGRCSWLRTRRWRPPPFSGIALHQVEIVLIKRTI